MKPDPQELLELEDVGQGKVLIRGELTHSTVTRERLLNGLRKKHQNNLQFDLSEVKRVDTAGLAWLIHCFAQLKQQGVHLELLHIPDQLHKLMQLGQVDNLFE